MAMELRQLRYFIAVAETLHFGRAAQQLHIAQQPLSFQIKQLEDELVVLFERTTRSVALTAAGAALLAEVQVGLERIARGVELAQRVARGEGGTLHIGYTSTTLYTVTPAIVRTFRERCPEVEVVLHELASPTLEQHLLRGDLDIGIVLFSGVTQPGLTYETIYREPVAVALPKRHRLAARATLTLAELADEPFVLYSRRAKRQSFDEIIALCHLAGFSPRIAQEADNESTVLGLVAAGLGVALVASSISGVRPDEIVYRQLVEPLLIAQVAVVWRDAQDGPRIAELRQIARAVTQLQAADVD
jgi:DNA-binding transcriptional LysR family regulator